ncbi:hypothetical protein J7E71_07830 [Mesobacillus foraminis]|uniref:hypothetical protein n=1 Tax=Mesobacillus foraminis TaxID=279826 RepID=UPI001BE6EB04|nr:hypothetical protein [Mesobacillus foraminis]MBT2755855.1 hypothetical protein [Mesobacillus foraminis]
MRVLILLLTIALAGCASKDSEELKWFDTDNEAIEYGLKLEDAKQSDVLGEMESDGEHFVVYKDPVPDEDGIAISTVNIAEENGKYAWYRANSYVKITDKNPQHNIKQVSYDTKTRSGKDFLVYAGYTKNEKITLETPEGSIQPKIDPSTGIYFSVVPIRE